MNPTEDRIPDDKAQEVFALAAQLYAQHSQQYAESYSVEELMDAGVEARIPPEFVQQAITQMQLQHTSPESLSTPPTKKGLKVWQVSLLLAIASAIAGWGIFRLVSVPQTSSSPVEVVTEPTQVRSANPPNVSFNKCTQLSGTDLRGANIAGADCANANLAGVDLTGATLNGTNFSGANLQNANLADANLRGVDLAGADLDGANLSGATIEGSNLSGTNLANANLSNTTIQSVDLARANLEGTNLDAATVDSVNFNGATMPDGTVHP